MLKLAGFNSTIYSFNKKTGVSFTPTIIAKRAMWRPLGVTVGLVPLILVRL